MAAKEFTYKGEKYSLSVEAAKSTGNCGFYELKNIYVTALEKASMLVEEKLIQEIVDSSELWEALKILSQYTNGAFPSIFVLSAHVSGGPTSAFYTKQGLHTARFMRAIRESKKGSCILSPMVDNTSHPSAKDDGFIAVMLWVPEAHSGSLPSAQMYSRIQPSGPPLKGKYTASGWKHCWDMAQKWAGLEKEDVAHRLIDKAAADGQPKTEDKGNSIDDGGWGIATGAAVPAMPRGPEPGAGVQPAKKIRRRVVPVPPGIVRVQGDNIDRRLDF